MSKRNISPKKKRSGRRSDSDAEKTAEKSAIIEGKAADSENCVPKGAVKSGHTDADSSSKPADSRSERLEQHLHTPNPILASDAKNAKLEKTLRHILASSRYANALLLTLVIAVVSFHPWVMNMISRAFSILPLLLLVAVFVYVVNPIVLTVMKQIRRLPGHSLISYNKSLLITYLLFLLTLVIAACIVVPRVVEELNDLASHFPALAKTVQFKLAQGRSVYNDLPPVVRTKLTDSLGAVASWMGGMIDGSLAYAGVISQAVVWCLGAMVMVPLISFYVMSDGEAMVKNALSCLPVQKRQMTREALNCIHKTMQNFIRGQVLLCCAVGGVTALAMAFVMPQYCLAMGVVAGITEAIPVLGPFLGAVPAVIIALAIPGGGITKALIVVVIYTLIQQLENNLLVPRIMGSSMGLHPVSLTLGMLVLGNMFGFWGVVFASPMLALIKTLITTLCADNIASADNEPAG